MSVETGEYFLRAELPNGATITRTFHLSPNDTGSTVHLSTTAEQRSTSEYVDPKPDLSVEFFGPSGIEDHEAVSKSPDQQTLPSSTFYEYLDVVRPPAKSRKGTLPWDQLWLELWDYDPSRKVHWQQQPIAEKLTTISRDDWILTLRWTGPQELYQRGKPYFWQLGGYGPISRFTAAPPAASCDLIVRQSFSPNDQNGGVGLRIVALGSDDASVELMIRYLEKGAIDAAYSMFEHAVLKLLNNDAQDPYGALVGAYFLLKYKISSWPSLDQIASLLDEFLKRFDGSPDVALLCAWIALQGPDSVRSDGSWLERSKANLVEAARRGIPIFALGLRYLSDTIRVLIASSEVSTENGARLEHVSQRLGCYLQAADESQLLTTYFSAAPWVPTKQEDQTVDHDLSCRLVLSECR
jgi:hypothetical protein